MRVGRNAINNNFLKYFFEENSKNYPYNSLFEKSSQEISIVLFFLFLVFQSLCSSIF